jgi:hypothetical protein
MIPAAVIMVVAVLFGGLMHHENTWDKAIDEFNRLNTI